MIAAAHLCALRAAIVYARRVTILPITEDGQLITVARSRVDRLLRCTFPTGVKMHPRVRTTTVVHRLLAVDLSCQYTDLRLVALLDPEPGLDREAVYAAQVRWPAGRPEFAGCGRHRLQPISTANEARQMRLWPRRVATLLAGPDLAASANVLPELLCAEQQAEAADFVLKPAAVPHG